MNKRIKELRKTLGLNQTEFGAKIGVGQGTVTAYETANRTPSNAVVMAICKEFGVSEQWLRDGVGEMFIPISVEDSLARIFDSVSHDPDDAFRRKVFLGLAKLSPDDWELIEQIIKKMMSEP